MAGYCVFNANISFTFQAIKNLYAHLTYLCFGLFCKFLGDFWVYLERNSFSQRISKIDGNRKFGRFVVVLKLEFEIKNWYIHSKQLPNNLGCHCAVGQLSGGVP